MFELLLSAEPLLRTQFLSIGLAALAVLLAIPSLLRTLSFKKLAGSAVYAFTCRLRLLVSPCFSLWGGDWPPIPYKQLATGLHRRGQVLNWLKC